MPILYLPRRGWISGAGGAGGGAEAQGSNVKRHLQDYLITLYNETVPLERWVQIETAITKEELESAQAAEDQKSMRLFIFGRMAMTVSSQRVMARNFWMWPYGCAVICKETPRR